MTAAALLLLPLFLVLVLVLLCDEKLSLKKKGLRIQSLVMILNEDVQSHREEKGK